MAEETIQDAALKAYLKEQDEKRDAALKVAMEYGGIDGGHHKEWVIDQMVRALLGDSYPQFVLKFCAGEDGCNTYIWPRGIAP